MELEWISNVGAGIGRSGEWESKGLQATTIKLFIGIEDLLLVYMILINIIVLHMTIYLLLQAEWNRPTIIYPVVKRGAEPWLYPYSLLNGEPLGRVFQAHDSDKCKLLNLWKSAPASRDLDFVFLPWMKMIEKSFLDTL